MQYRPEHSDLLEAIQEFLLKEILPFVKDEDALAYKTLVSWNMLGVVSRELKNGRALLERDASLLAGITGDTANIAGAGDRALLREAHALSRAAARKIRSGKITLGSSEWTTIKEILKDNLQISNPRYGVD